MSWGKRTFGYTPKPPQPPPPCAVCGQPGWRTLKPRALVLCLECRKYERLAKQRAADRRNRARVKAVEAAE